MSDIKLFQIAGNRATEIQGSTAHLEKPLQTLIETNLEALLGIRLIASEHSTGKTHAGRIDTLGLDENNSPVIIEYKRSTHENIINQGLFYLDWLMDHQAEFKLLTLEKMGKEEADAIDWSGPRLICIAADFTKYDSHAVQQMDRNIELIRYRRFGRELMLLELANAVSADPIDAKKNKKPAKTSGTDKTVAEWLVDISPELRGVLTDLEAYLQTLGDDIHRKDLKLYIAFKRLRNFLTVCFQRNALLLYLHVNPDDILPVDGFTRDVRTIGHWGTGNVELTVRNRADLDKALPLIDKAYTGGNDAA